MQYFSVMLVRVRMIMTAAIAVIVVIVVVVMATAAAIVGMIMRVIMRVIGLGEYALYLYGGVIVHMQALAAVIANFKRIEIAKFALAAIYAVTIV